MSTLYALPLGPGIPGLTDADFQRAADTLQCDLAAIQAVADVESAGDGFLPSGRPKILFEAHVFSRLTRRRHDGTHPNLSCRRWNRALYAGGERSYGRLEQAMALGTNAALQSASWGRFQIMGFNYKAAGYASVELFVDAMFVSEAHHLDAFVNFLKSTRLDTPLREHEWETFARGYNGAGYASNHYDIKLMAAYEKYGGTMG